MKRALRPKATAALVVAPATASDLTSHAVFGLDAAVFRALVRKLGCPHVNVGRRIVVVAEFVESLQGAAGGAPVSGESVASTDETPAADALLARLGRSRRAA